jgi:polyhydroxyalkanoate synthase
MNSPPPSAQALYENLSLASRKFAEDVLGSLSAGQPLESAEIFKLLAASLAQDSEHWAALQQRDYQRHLELWTSIAARADTARAATATPPAPVAVPDKGDRRFQSAEWQQLPFFDYLKQAYLINSRWLAEVVEAVQLDAPAKRKLRFFTRQLVDAAAPANFPATNPDVLKLASETRGESLLRGLENLNEDRRKGRISTTDESAFEVGRNIAVTPGAVVYENELMQLIQYRPATDTVYERPLVMFPPCINKYYILDLQPENSFVRYAVAQGHTVFMVSWRNVSADLGQMTWDQYLELGMIKALEVARGICGVRQINALGFCVGGTLLAAALAVLRAKRRNLAASVTYLTTMLDFSDAGDISVYIDEAYVSQREKDFAHGGVLHGKELALTFSSLRPNDLIWNYVVNNYLKGRKPEAFDLLYWNSDSTNLPGAMFVYYVRNTYLENNLRVPGKLTNCGVKVDLSKIKLPTFVLASREDHIVPWKSAYQTTQLVGGNIEFVLAASGHIAGIINPPSQNRRHHWLNPALPSNPDDWLAGAREHPGSWWSRWSGWLAGHGGASVAARTELGGARYPVIEPAPGRYVKQRCD